MTDYYETFIVQFIQTLAQLSAGILTASVAVPMYSFYVRGNYNLFDPVTDQDQADEIHKSSVIEEDYDNDNDSNDVQVSSTVNDDLEVENDDTDVE
jgi:hypothetical protein